MREQRPKKPDTRFGLSYTEPYRASSDLCNGYIPYF